jgi:hypothetical protein
MRLSIAAGEQKACGLFCVCVTVALAAAAGGSSNAIEEKFIATASAGTSLISRIKNIRV